MNIVEETSNIAEHFEQFFDIELTDDFSLEKFAEEHDLSLYAATVLLVNLEDESVVNDIAKGDYSSFDEFDSDQFNDMYGHMMRDLKNK